MARSCKKAPGCSDWIAGVDPSLVGFSTTVAAGSPCVVVGWSAAVGGSVKVGGALRGVVSGVGTDIDSVTGLLAGTAVAVGAGISPKTLQANNNGIIRNSPRAAFRQRLVVILANLLR
jgi:hypothetical protein